MAHPADLNITIVSCDRVKVGQRNQSAQWWGHYWEGKEVPGTAHHTKYSHKRWKKPEIRLRPDSWDSFSFLINFYGADMSSFPACIQYKDLVEPEATPFSSLYGDTIRKTWKCGIAVAAITRKENEVSINCSLDEESYPFSSCTGGSHYKYTQLTTGLH